MITPDCAGLITRHGSVIVVVVWRFHTILPPIALIAAVVLTVYNSCPIFRTLSVENK
jgi:hypothetical protein